VSELGRRVGEGSVAVAGLGSIGLGLGEDSSLNRVNSRWLASSLRARAAVLSKVNEEGFGSDLREGFGMSAVGSELNLLPEPEV
jgi:hypothetical protein